MATDLPLKMRVWAQNAPSQIHFAFTAQAVIAASDRYRLEVDRSGLIVFASTESELEELAHILQDMHKGRFALEFGSPMVCLRQYKGRLYQPVIHLRIQIQAKALQTILLDLMDRQACLLEVHYRNDHVVIRAHALLTMFIGYISNLRILTQGLFDLWLQVVDYRLVQELGAVQLSAGGLREGAALMKSIGSQGR